jgi:L-rhamnose mutarotase
MIRKAFLMKLKDGKVDEYEKLHNPIWPELYDVLKSHGVYNYSIFHESKSNLLLGYMEIENEEKFNEICKSETCQKWWLNMKNYLESDSKESTKAKEEALREVFHID